MSRFRTANLRHASRRALAGLLAASLMAAPAATTARADEGLRIIRDAEIEALLRDYAVPIFRAAGLNPAAVEVIIVEDSGINSFVAGGQRIFINTGMITETQTPNELIGVLAHETGHIAGGHLARKRQELERASISQIATMILGAAAAAGGALSGNSQIGAAGASVARGGAGFAQRTLLQYSRSLEASADQAAVRFLNATGQSSKGLLSMFQRLADEMLVSLRNVDPYLLSHPAPPDRIAYLGQLAESSPYFDRKDPPDLVLRHELMKAKVRAYIGQPASVGRLYPAGDQSLPARYAHAITAYRAADLPRALRDIDGLIRDMPKNPYFWELKGEALLSGQDVREAVAAYRKAVDLDPDAPLIRISLAHAMVESGDRSLVDPAIDQLKHALVHEKRSSVAYNILAQAYAARGDEAHAELASALGSATAGHLEQAKHFAKRARDRFSSGSPEWLQADDILNIKQ